MSTYIIGFIFYTMAMIGILVVGYLVYKKTNIFNQVKTNGLIKVIDTLAISPKKVLMVVKIKNEKFLIASGVEHTTFLAKLEQNETLSINKPLENNKIQQSKNFSQELLESKQNKTINYNLAKNEQVGFDNEITKNKSMQTLADNIMENKTKLQKLQKQFDDLYNADMNNKNFQDNLNSSNKNEFVDRIYSKKLKNSVKNKVQNGYEQYLNKQEVFKQLLK